MTAVSREFGRFARAGQFLTRLPVPDPGWEPAGLARAAPYFSLVGALIGAAMGAVWWAAAQGLAPGIAAGLALGVGVWLTGGLHEDGLADCADALGGQATKARALEIMRDSRIGTYGVLSLFIAIGLRWAALAALAPTAGALALIVAGSSGRAMIVPVAFVLTPARPDGLGSMLGARSDGTGITRSEVAAALAIAGAAAGMAGWPGLLALLAAGAAAALLAALLHRRIGGHTGDGLGAVAAVGETAALVMLAGALA